VPARLPTSRSPAKRFAVVVTPQRILDTASFGVLGVSQAAEEWFDVVNERDGVVARRVVKYTRRGSGIVPSTFWCSMPAGMCCCSVVQC
jgi:hypothetical protein